MSQPVRERVCWDCGGTRDLSTRLPQGLMCHPCRRRRHYHHQSCPGCGTVRPLAWLVDDRVVCASCANMDSIFACGECGREDHPYGYSRCARCILRERLTNLLTDPVTGQVHTRLQPVFDELVGSERPQSGISWLRKKPGVGPRLLGQMARGEVEISHDTFGARPSDRAHDYLRSLLAALGVLPPFEVRIERVLAWLDAELATLPHEHADLIRRFTHWHVLRHMRRAAHTGRLTRSGTDAARRRIRVAIQFLAFLHDHGATATTATQDHLERYQEAVGGKIDAEQSFIAWLRATRINTSLHIPYVALPAAEVTVSDQQRWDHVHRLLHDQSLRRYARIGGLFTLLFAQPLSRIVSMQTSQVTVTDIEIYVAFNGLALQMPPGVDDLLREHLQHRGKSLYVSRNTGWLFPGGNPGQHMNTENIRAHLVAIGMKPHESRKAALFQLAAEVPAPVLAELIGISNKNAASWAQLAARDWTGYIADRDRLPGHYDFRRR